MLELSLDQYVFHDKNIVISNTTNGFNNPKKHGFKQIDYDVDKILFFLGPNEKLIILKKETPHNSFMSMIWNI